MNRNLNTPAASKSGNPDFKSAAGNIEVAFRTLVVVVNREITARP